MRRRRSLTYTRRNSGIDSFDVFTLVPFDMWPSRYNNIVLCSNLEGQLTVNTLTLEMGTALLVEVVSIRYKMIVVHSLLALEK